MRKTSRGATYSESRLRLPRRWGTRSARGQSLVEFGLVLPLLFVFLLGVADFGRIFADGIALEAAARNAAEAAAQEYLQFWNGIGDPTATGLADTTQYDNLHDLAVEVGCREAERLTNVQVIAGACTNPLIAICIHDDAGTDGGRCGQEGFATGVPAGCTGMNDPASWSPTRAGPVDGRPYVEVRMCYLFVPLFPLTENWWGDVRLQRENNFAVTNY